MAETGERRQIASRRSGEPVYESLEQVAQRQAAERASGVGGSLAVLNAQPSDFTPSGPGVPAGVYSDEELSRRIESQRMNEQQDAAERQREIAAIEEQKQNPDTITPGHPVVDHVRLGREAFEKLYLAKRRRRESKTLHGCWDIARASTWERDRYHETTIQG